MILNKFFNQNKTCGFYFYRSPCLILFRFEIKYKWSILLIN